MGYPTPKITQSGDGMWANGKPDLPPSTGNSGNALSQVGKTVGNSSVFSNTPKGPGSGTNGSPDPGLIGASSTPASKPGAGTGPSPDQNLLDTTSKSAPAPREVSFGGMEKGVQIP